MTDFAITPRVPPATDQAQNLAATDTTATQLAPIEGTIDSSGLSMFRRLLMKGATALGLEVGQPRTTADPTVELTVAEREPTLAEKIKLALLESRLGRHLVYLGESLADFAYATWDRITGTYANSRTEKTVDYHPITHQVAPDTAPTSHIQPISTLVADLKKDLDADDRRKDSEVISAALHQVADAVRRKDEEAAKSALSEEQERHARTQHARDIIEAIDARGGTIANNPRVQAILDSLGTPYDSIQQAIAQVEALQREEEELTPN